MATLRAASEAVTSFVSHKTFEWAVKANVFLLPTALILLAEAMRSRIALRADVGRQLLGIGDSFWTVTLFRSVSATEMEPLGMDLDLLDPALLQVSKVTSNSIVDRYNQTVPEEKQIQAGDFILQVNRITGEATAMADQLAAPTAERFTLTLQRPTWQRVCLTGLGREQELRHVLTSLQRSDASLYVTRRVLGVNGLRRHDRIMAVDDVQGDLHDAIGAALSRGEPFEVSVARPGVEAE
eukprot:symbB.v1.2.035679.t1/scaffold4720.1/size35926/3